MICTHEGPCDHTRSSHRCALRQRAESVKYSVNDTWQFAEIAPDTFALYNPVHRELRCIGTLDECLATYRAREPYVPKRPLPAPRPTIDTSKLEFKL